MRRTTISAFVFGIAMVASAMLLPQFGAVPEGGTLVYVYKMDGASPLLHQNGVSVLAEYPTYFVASVDQSKLSYMEKNGIPFREVSSKIQLLRGTFDTSVPDSIPAGMALATGGMSIIQFVGPVEQQWKDDVQLMGVKIYDYVPDYAMIADIPAKALGKVQGAPYVRWVGAFDAQYRISPALDSASGQTPIVLLISDWESARSVAFKILKTGGSISYMSQKTPAVVQATADAQMISYIASQSGVLWVEPQPELVLWNANASKTVQNFKAFNNSLWDRGLHGEGQVMGITDSGLNQNHTAFATVPGKIACYLLWPGATMGDDKGLSYHGSHTAGTLAGYDPANPINKGMAYQANICITDVGRDGSPSGSLVVPTDLRDLYTPMLQYDTKIISNSWGYRYNSQTAGAYLTTSYTADAFMWANPESLLVFAQGNDDHTKDMKVMAPSTAKSLVSAGGTDNGNATPRPQENVFISSSSGPTNDGRIKPTVMAPANPLFSVDGSKNSGDIGMAGTSMAAPATAGSLGLVRQYFKEGWYPLGEKRPNNGFNASAALLKAIAMNSADDMTGTDAKNPIPNTVEGWGRLDLENTLYFLGDSRTMKIMDFKDGISTFEFMDFAYNITASEPLKMTLAWTDYPGSTAASKQLVNDLDMIVTAPNGTVYYGNNFANGESKSGGAPDSTNVEEQVLIKAPAAGTYKVRIFAANAAMGPQPYAFVMTANFDMLQGTVKLDKASYGEGQTVQITLEDNSYSGSSIQTAQCTVTSNTETTPETVTLSGKYGILTGSIQTTLVAPVADGKISVSQGDTIKVECVDANPPGKSIATAKVDLKTPALTNVHVEYITDSGGVVMWNSSKSSTSTVYYGKTPQDVANKINKVVVSQLSVLHMVGLTGLDSQTLYYFDVESTDRNGHTILADNAGRHYTFTTMAVTDVLFINLGGLTEDATYKYTGQYQADFAKYGWGMNLVTPEVTGLPTIPTLQKYKVVYIETGLDKYPPVTDIQAALIKDYNEKGGRLFVSGHDIGWALVKSDSGYYQPWGDLFVKTQLKSTWLSDPGGWKQIKGIAGDPISGDFAAGVPYTACRGGSDGEEVAPYAAGGTSVITWKNDANLDTSIRWNSSANNGTSGQGYWGGSPSKVVWHTFEILCLKDAGTRAKILNNTLVWLIGHAAPIVKVTNPTGGTISGTVQVSWDVSTFGGTSVKAQTLYLSEDDGQGWVNLTSIPPGTKTYSWDTTKLNNGDKYRVKMVAADDGTPSLTGSDASGRLIIANPNGDKRGPLVVPGSISLEPNPGKSGMAAFINSTIDDTATGVSNITGAEVFFDTTGANGTGQVMNASDLAWSSPTEDVFYYGNLSLAPGPHKLFVHGLDVAGNWGPFANLSIVVNPGTPNYSAAPKVQYHSPTGDNISLTTQVSALFSKPMDWTATKSAFSLKDSGGAAVTGSTFGSGNTLMFTPSAPLTYGTLYTAKVDTTAKDENGKNLAADFIWNFRTLPYFGWISGRTYEDVAGVKVSLGGVTVKVLNQTGEVNKTISLSDGTYAVGAQPGAYSVNGSKLTYLPAQKDNIIIRPGKFTPGVDLVLVLGLGIITGNVTCNAKPVPGATLKLYDSTGAFVKSVSSPQNGHYTFTDVVMGTYAVNASKAGVGEKNVTGVVVEAKKTTWMNIEICAAPTPGSITGKVLDKANSQGIANADVEAKNSSATKTVKTAADGTYTIDQLAADTYTVTASAGGYISQAVPGVAVSAGKTSYVWFNLTAVPSGKGWLKGSVKDQDAHNLSGATVTAVSGTTTLTATTDTYGNYSIQNVPTTLTYTVTASMPGYKSDQKTGIAVNSTTDLTLTAIMVKGSTPSDKAPDVAIDASITITFSVPMNTSSVIAALTLAPTAGDLTASWTDGDKSVTFTHSQNFDNEKSYTLTISKTTAKDKDGNAMLSDFTLTFTTVKAGGGGFDMMIPLAAVIAIIVVALILFAVLRMRKKPAAEGEEKKPEEKKEEEKKEEEKKEGEAKPEEPKPVDTSTPPEAESKPPEAETTLRP